MRRAARGRSGRRGGSDSSSCRFRSGRHRPHRPHRHFYVPDVGHTLPTPGGRKGGGLDRPASTSADGLRPETGRRRRSAGCASGPHHAGATGGLHPVRAGHGQDPRSSHGAWTPSTHTSEPGLPTEHGPTAHRIRPRSHPRPDRRNARRGTLLVNRACRHPSPRRLGEPGQTCSIDLGCPPARRTTPRPPAAGVSSCFRAAFKSKIWYLDVCAAQSLFGAPRVSRRSACAGTLSPLADLPPAVRTRVRVLTDFNEPLRIQAVTRLGQRPRLDQDAGRELNPDRQ